MAGVQPDPDLGLCHADGAAVFTLSVSTVGLRTSAMPRWVAYFGYLVALTLLVAAGEHKWFQLLFPVWVLLVSVVILFVRPSSRDADHV
jgi:hypothetical protein